MMLMRFDPFRDLDQVAQMLRQQTSSLSQASMPMDAYRAGDRLVVQMDLPGVDADSIDVTVEKNVLTVKAERSWKPTEEQEVVISERPQGTFTRQLFLGDGLDADKIEAKYDQGVLSISIPVADEAKPKRVQIASGDRSDRAIEATATSAA